IWGRHDSVIPLGHSEFFRDCIGNSQLKVIDDAGHAPFAEKPIQVCKLLREFLL
ncbi:MAG: alpha/beta hydrolase, partial [Nitrosopumilus sp.]|nr:alpha/beta hydrolase [Nitrosopumilus sp.]